MGEHLRLAFGAVLVLVGLALYGLWGPGDPALGVPLAGVDLRASSGERAAVDVRLADGTTREVAIVSARGTSLPVSFLGEGEPSRLVGLAPVTLGLGGTRERGDRLAIVRGDREQVAVVVWAETGELRAYRARDVAIYRDVAPGGPSRVRVSQVGDSWDVEAHLTEAGRLGIE